MTRVIKCELSLKVSAEQANWFCLSLDTLAGRNIRSLFVLNKKAARPHKIGKVICLTWYKATHLKAATYTFCHFSGFYPEEEIAVPTVLWVGYFIAKEKKCSLIQRAALVGRSYKKGFYGVHTCSCFNRTKVSVYVSSAVFCALQLVRRKRNKIRPCPYLQLFCGRHTTAIKMRPETWGSNSARKKLPCTHKKNKKERKCRV